MKKQDFYVIIGISFFLAPFFLWSEIYRAYATFNQEHGFITAFFKFALLATFGEALGLRIRQGVYNRKGFGLLPRAMVWGFLGLTIKAAFVIFATGTPRMLEALHINGASRALAEPFSGLKLLAAFVISATLNLFYAPVMMTFHKITDTHITNHNGKLSALTKKIHFAEILKQMDWHTMFHFVFKKTIPLFWIPAHTFTFLLPEEFRVLFAALLGVALGVILALAAQKQDNGNT
ncbi:MAG: hypothetical protein CSB06_03915 [Bacteroidia bacterium]|nr:MAG: hypothetical protein CSB06_03915 [Bacteroidia bacterium]